ncbi:hypothetical protein [Luteibacter sp. 22Crub2.1]|uniref:hypothetical protein n=1 Tax=Luteibacter sp. 22Crub2.1 TaxID=1283288 RepID=UPI0009A7ADCB|nr:hypothetical protein [Luteibacter sp. 22Crub2.1]SKB50743.1 hypothetical protein SAMN05660880_01372 [Luteibacter sp. 22Crub2.1]
MADTTNIPAQDTQFVPTIGQPTALQTEHAEILAKDAAKQTKDKTTVGDLIGATAVNGSIGLIDRTIDGIGVKPDPTFYGKAFAAKRQEWINRGINDEQLPLLEKAMSAEDADRLYTYARENQEAEQTHAQFGFVGNTLAGLGDPGEFALGALSGGLGYGLKATRLANAVRAGAINAVQGVGMEAAKSAYDPTIDSTHLAAAGVMSFTLGGAFGFRQGELGAMMKAADEIAHKPEAVGAPAGVKNPNDSMGAARVHGSAVDTMDGPIIDDANWQQHIRDDAALVGGTKQTKWAQARTSLSAKLGANKSGVVSNESKKLLRDGVGYADRSVAVEESASEMSLRLRDTEETKFRRAVEPLWDKYKADNDLHFDYGKAEFMEEAGRAMRDPGRKVSAEASQIAQHVNESTTAMWKHLHEAGVEGFEESNPPHKNWLPRVHSAKGFISLLQEKALRWDDVVGKLVKPAMRKAWEAKGVNFDEDTLNEVAEAWARRGYDKATQAKTANPGGAYNARDVDTIEQLLTDAGQTSSKARALVEKLRAKQDETALLPHAKRRIDMDESYSTDLTDEFGNVHKVSISDLLENNVDKLTGDYIREMSGWAALKSKTGVGTPRRLAEYKAFLNQESVRSGGGDISRKLDITLNSILGHSTEDQPHAALSRASRVIRSQNYLTTMLQVGYSMIEGLGTTMGAAGFRNTLKAVPGSRAMLRRMKTGELDLEEARWLEDIIAPGTDYIRNQPYLRIDDGVYYGTGSTGVGRAVDALENAQAYGKRAASILSGMAPIQTYLQRLAGRAVAARTIELANKVKLSEAEVFRLRNDGMTEASQKALFARLQGKTKIDQIAKDWDKWSPDERAAYSAYMWRVTHRAVTEGDVSDTAQIMHSSIGKIFWQFRTFMTSSYERSLLNGLHMRDWQTAKMWSGSTFFAGVGMAARNYINTVGDPELRQKLLDPAELGKQAFQQASYSSIIPFMVDTVARDLHARKLLGGKDEGFFESGRSTGLDAGVAGIPTLSTVKSLYALAGLPGKAASGSVTQKDVRDVMKLVWFNNMTGVRNGLSQFYKMFPETADE